MESIVGIFNSLTDAKRGATILESLGVPRNRISVLAPGTTEEDLEVLLRQLMNSREIRQFRSKGEIHFKSVFEGRVPVVGDVKIEGFNIHVELRKIGA